MAKWSMLSDEGSRVPLAKTMPFSMSQSCTVTNLSSVRLSFHPTWEPEMMKAFSPVRMRKLKLPWEKSP